MSELISGKEALIAFLDGKEVEFKDVTNTWHKAHSGLTLDVVSRYQFRLKPRTITINGIKVPAPFDLKDGDDFRIYYLHGLHKRGYDWMHSSHYKEFHLVWRTEEEIKQVVAALRSIFNESN